MINRILFFFFLLVCPLVAQQQITNTPSSGGSATNSNLPYSNIQSGVVGGGGNSTAPLNISPAPMSASSAGTIITFPPSALVVSVETEGLYNMAALGLWNGNPVTVDNMPSDEDNRLHATLNFYVLPTTPNVLYIQVTDVHQGYGYATGGVFENVTMTGIRFLLIRRKAFGLSPVFSNGFANPGQILEDGTSGTQVNTILTTTPNYVLDTSADPVWAVRTQTGAEYGFTNFTGIWGAIRILGGGVFQFSFPSSVDLMQDIDFSKTFADAIWGRGNQFFGIRQSRTANQPPIAKAGSDQIAECAGPNGTTVILDGSASNDPNGDALTFQWRDEFGNLISNAVAARVNVPIGTHLFTLTVADAAGLTSTSSVHVTIHDTTPPSLNVSLSPNLLWPPNGKLVPITAALQIADTCDAAPTVKLVSITSNESLGVGDVQNAVLGTDDRNFSLAATRNGLGTGRIYTVTYEVRDHSGNTTTGASQVVVPLDSSH